MNSNTGIYSLNYDILKIIMLLVVASPSGVTDLAKTMAVCKMFTPFGDEEDLLKMASFEHFALPNSVENCEHARSLLIRCAEAQNVDAQYFLAQVILVRYSHVVDGNILPPFLSYFMPEQTINSDSDKEKLTHFGLVGLFLSRCSFLDHVSMLPHVRNYVEHCRRRMKTFSRFFHCFNSMTSILRAIVDVGRDNLLKYCPVEPEMRNARDVLNKFGTSITQYCINKAAELSQLEWEELKRECGFMVKEILSFENHAKPIEENDKVVDMGRRIFYYLAFNGPVTREMDLALDRDADKLWAISMRFGKFYYIYQQRAASSFNDMFVSYPYGKRKREAGQEQERESQQQEHRRNVPGIIIPIRLIN